MRLVVPVLSAVRLVVLGLSAVRLVVPVLLSQECFCHKNARHQPLLLP